jgi:hypothetical protein
MTRRSRQGPKSGRVAEGMPPVFWPGFLLNLLLPGSGFSYLGRPWRHLGALLLTVLTWLLAWLLMLEVAYRGQSSRTVLSPPLAFGLEGLALMMAVGAYPVLSWRYVAVYRTAAGHALSRWRWLPVCLHALLGVVGIWWALVRLNPPY